MFIFNIRRTIPISFHSLWFCLCTVLYTLAIPNSLLSQGSDDYDGGFKVTFNEEGTKYFRFIHWHQVWIRGIQNNPSTMGIEGSEKSWSTDIGMRRSRFLMYGQVNEDFLILAHWGINNQTFNSGGGSGSGGVGGYGSGKKPQLFVHDAWTEFRVFDNQKKKTTSKAFSMYFGAGLHYWNGITRASSASTLNIMSVDLAVFAYPGIEITDQFARQYGIYTKGRYGKLFYQMHLNKPFLADNSAAIQRDQAVNIPTENLAIGGYFEWQLRDQEAHKLPYRVGTYIGSKDVFNIGAGFFHHPNASGTGTNTIEERHNHTHFGFDIFLDRPLNKEKGTAVTWYSAVMLYNYGPNYFRSVGIMNVNPNGINGQVAGENGTSISGFGNAEPFLGTGTISYNKVGFLLPKTMLPTKTRFQPYLVYTQRWLEYLGTPTSTIDVGLNMFVDGHHGKLTFQYSSRPIVEGTLATGFDSSKRAGTFTLQMQVYL